ncbi:heat-inducible transcriptional repressor HrcA [Candidatus Hydrogenedentota bacterium]
MNTEIDNRHREVLAAIIDTYLTTESAVGSRTLVKACNLDYSPATVRNVMADLEDAGLIGQPHVSAGRIPTTTGYRLYVDTLMKSASLDDSWRNRISRGLLEQSFDFSVAAQVSAEVIAELSGCAAIVESASMDLGHLEQLELMPAGDNALMMMAVDAHGVVRSGLLGASNRSRGDLQLISHLMRTAFGSLEGPCDSIERKELLSRALGTENQEFIDEVWEIGRRVIDFRPGDLHVSGIDNLLEQPEFQSIGRARRIISLMNDRARLSSFIDKASAPFSPTRNPRVIIGEELGVDEAADCSMIITHYSVGGASTGRMGIVGPKRMPYSELIELLRLVSGEMEKNTWRRGSRREFGK